MLLCPCPGFVRTTPSAILPTSCGYVIKPPSTTASARDSILLLQETPRSHGARAEVVLTHPIFIPLINLVSPPSASATLSRLSLIGTSSFPKQHRTANSPLFRRNGAPEVARLAPTFRAPFAAQSLSSTSPYAAFQTMRRPRPVTLLLNAPVLSLTQCITISVI